MKINNNLTQIKVGKVYHWDVGEIINHIHIGTKTVKVLSICNRTNQAPLAQIQSMETNEIFSASISYLQLNPDYLKRKYNTLMRYYKKYKPNMIFKHTSFVDHKTKKYIIIGNQPEINNVLALDEEGVVHQFDYSWVEKLNLERNKSFDQQQEDQMNDFYHNFCDDFDD